MYHFLYYLNSAKKEIMNKISWAIGGPRPPSKYAHVASPIPGGIEAYS